MRFPFHVKAGKDEFTKAADSNRSFISKHDLFAAVDGGLLILDFRLKILDWVWWEPLRFPFHAKAGKDEFAKAAEYEPLISNFK